jgi:hypothetical protein
MTEKKANQPNTIRATTRAIGKVKPQKSDIFQSSFDNKNRNSSLSHNG